MHTKMKLRSYLDTLPRGGVSEFAARIGVSPVYLSQLAVEQDGRVPSPALCVVIERESFRAVCRQDLRPTDWRLIWPELDGAQAIVDAQNQPQAHASQTLAATETVAVEVA